MQLVEELETLADEAGSRGDFGLGSPNEMPPWLAILRFIFELLNFVVKKHGYAPRYGMRETRLAVGNLCNKQFDAGLTLDLDTEAFESVAILEGTRGGCVEVLREFVGDVVLPTDYYPGHLHAIREAGSNPIFIPMPSVKEYLRAIRQWMETDKHFRPRVVILSFDNPRWLRREYDDYVMAMKLHHDFGCLILSDEAYADLPYGDVRVESIMRVPGWMKGVIVLKSFSKSYCIAGWKIGAIIGDPEWIDNTVERKNKRSEGGCVLAQLAAATALKWCPGFPRKIARRYQHRAELTIRLLKAAGITDFEVSEGGMFLYFRPPGNSIEFLRKFARKGYIARPGEQFGRAGYVRWCLREPDWVTAAACRVVSEIMAQTFAEAAFAA